MKYTQDSGKQFHIYTKEGEVGKYVILPGDPKRCKKIAKYLDNAQLIADNREYTTYTGYLDGVKVSVTSTGIGGPSASIALEELVQCGADTFIRVGTSGGMDIDVKGGDIVVATGSVRMEGTTREYVPIEFPAVANLQVTNALVEASKITKKRCHVGVVQSKDSFYGQHSPHNKPISYDLENKWQAWIRCGCLASEMESAALFIVGSYLKVRVGAVFTVLANQEREKNGLDNVASYDTEIAVEIAVQAIKNLIKSDNKE